MSHSSIQFPRVFQSIFEPHRYKVYYGGRGGGKSWAVARALLVQSLRRPLRILCAREFQSSMADSVHRLLSEQIEDLGFHRYFIINKTSIQSATGSDFIFKGLRQNPGEIKSTEGVDICWVEEAQSVSAASWDVLLPTIRKPDSEIWITFNPGTPTDATWTRFVINPPPDSIVQRVLFSDNPWFPSVLDKERLYLQSKDDDAYRHIWLGEPKTISDSQVFKDRFTVEAFTTPKDAEFYHGADWGFAKDPTVLIRCFIKDNVLHIDNEAYGVGVELDNTPALFDNLDTAKRWPIIADSARPETISFMKRRGYNVRAATKWKGSIEDGLAVLKGFEGIKIHPRCVHTIDEFRLYSYKTNHITGDILPELIDANNHCIDALRYALNDYIRGKGQIIIPRKTAVKSRLLAGR